MCHRKHTNVHVANVAAVAVQRCRVFYGTDIEAPCPVSLSGKRLRARGVAKRFALCLQRIPVQAINLSFGLLFNFQLGLNSVSGVCVASHLRDELSSGR